MEVLSLLKVCLSLAFLGFTTSLFASLSVSSVLRSDPPRFYLCALYSVLAILCGFFSWYRNASLLSRAAHMTLAFIDLTCAIASPIVSFDFQFDAHYLNRVAYFMVLLIGITGSVALFWPYLVGFVARDSLTEAGVSPPQEGFLYVIWALVVSVTVAWVIPLKESWSRKELFNTAVVNVIGFWFLGAVLAAGLGFLLMTKGTGGTTPGYEK
jgi:hypothetical protein